MGSGASGTGGVSNAAQNMANAWTAQHPSMGNSAGMAGAAAPATNQRPPNPPAGSMLQNAPGGSNMLTAPPPRLFMTGAPPALQNSPIGKFLSRFQQR